MVALAFEGYSEIKGGGKTRKGRRVRKGTAADLAALSGGRIHDQARPDPAGPPPGG